VLIFIWNYCIEIVIFQKKSKMKIFISLLLVSFFFCGCKSDSEPYPLQVIAEQEPPEVSSPEFGAIIKTGSEIKIEWSRVPGKNIKLELVKKKTYLVKVIEEETENTGSYSWIIPEDTPGSVSYAIKLSYQGTPGNIYSGTFQILN
jgi:hypothetical protein